EEGFHPGADVALSEHGLLVLCQLGGAVALRLVALEAHERAEVARPERGASRPAVALPPEVARPHAEERRGALGAIRVEVGGNRPDLLAALIDREPGARVAEVEPELPRDGLEAVLAHRPAVHLYPLAVRELVGPTVVAVVVYGRGQLAHQAASAPISRRKAGVSSPSAVKTSTSSSPSPPSGLSHQSGHGSRELRGRQSRSCSPATRKGRLAIVSAPSLGLWTMRKPSARSSSSSNSAAHRSPSSLSHSWP